MTRWMILMCHSTNDISPMLLIIGLMSLPSLLPSFMRETGLTSFLLRPWASASKTKSSDCVWTTGWGSRCLTLAPFVVCAAIRQILLGITRWAVVVMGIDRIHRRDSIRDVFPRQLSLRHWHHARSLDSRF